MQLHLACRGPKGPRTSMCRKCCIWWMVANTVCTHIKPVSCRHDLCLCLGRRRHHLRHHFRHVLRHILRHRRRRHHHHRRRRHHHHRHHRHHHNHHNNNNNNHHHHHHRPCHYHIIMYLEHVVSDGSTIHFSKIWNLYIHMCVYIYIHIRCKHRTRPFLAQVIPPLNPQYLV